MPRSTTSACVVPHEYVRRRSPLREDLVVYELRQLTDLVGVMTAHRNTKRRGIETFTNVRVVNVGETF